MTTSNGFDSTPRGDEAGLSRRSFIQGAAGAALLVGAPAFVRPGAAGAASNAITVENQKVGSRNFQLGQYQYNSSISGFSTQASVNRGEVLKVRLNDWTQPWGGPATQAQLEIYRLGYYGGEGGRLVRTQSVPLRNQGFLDENNRPLFDKFGHSSAAFRWTETVDVATSDLVSGVYLAKIKPAAGNGENHFPFIVREDGRNRDILLVMPTNTWQAYNSWPGKCLYVGPDYRGDYETIAGRAPDGKSRALKVSFDRPHNNVFDDLNWVLRTEFPLIYWLERQGYNVTYTEDTAVDRLGSSQLRSPRTKVLAFAGHAEYWTKKQFDKVLAARNAGTHLASFSANAAYWQVRYEDDRRTLVCFKTVLGTTADGPDGGRDGVNDFGPLISSGSTGGAQGRGGPYDPLVKGSAYSSTTFRDAGAPAGSASAPDNVGSAPQTQGTDRSFEGNRRVGPNRPENQLWGVMYVGDHDVVSYPMQVPAGSGNGGEFGSHPAWRKTTVANRGGARIGRDLVGWEWDAIPQGTASQAYGRYVSRQPAGVKRLAATNPRALVLEVPPESRGGLGYLQDEGRTYSHQVNVNTPASPPAGQGPEVHAVTYRASSGAQVFAAGTMQWSFGLGPHFNSLGDERTYESPRVEDSVQPVIQQATYNILSDMGVTPATPNGVVL